MEKIIGHIGVDSGQVLLIDPCYVLTDNFNAGGKPTGGSYDAVCRTTLTGDPTAEDTRNYKRAYGEVINGFAVSTLHGDGQYPVIAELNHRGEVVRITIDFDPQPSDEDRCEQCGYTDCYDEECVSNDDDSE